MLVEYKCDACQQKPDLVDADGEGNVGWRYILVDDITLLLCGRCGEGLERNRAYSLDTATLPDEIKTVALAKKAKTCSPTGLMPDASELESLFG